MALHTSFRRFIAASLLLIFALLSSCVPLTQPTDAPAVGTESNQAEVATAVASALQSTGQPTTAPVEAGVPVEQAPSPAPEIEGLYDFPENVNPLTGLVVADPSRLERRPIMSKVSNFPRTGRPHAGLSFADMVFEYYIGYGLNRFLGFITVRMLADRPGALGPPGGCAVGRNGNQSLLFYANADPQLDEVLLAELGNRALAEKLIPLHPNTASAKSSMRPPYS
jgi:hypothetical protein